MTYSTATATATNTIGYYFAPTSNPIMNINLVLFAYNDLGNPSEFLLVAHCNQDQFDMRDHLSAAEEWCLEMQYSNPIILTQDDALYTELFYQDADWTKAVPLEVSDWV